jgi:hypothetical protein
VEKTPSSSSLAVYGLGPHTRLVRGRLCTAEHRYITAGSALSEFDVGLRFGEDPAEGVWDDVDPDDEAAWNNYFDALVEDKIGGMPFRRLSADRYWTGSHTTGVCFFS